VRLIFGVGVDIVKTERVRDLIDRYGERFLRRVFLPGEIAYCRRRSSWAEAFAAHVAAKEAASKALGTGWRRGIHWKCVEVAHERSGKPTLKLHAAAQAIAEQSGVTNVQVSLTHDGGFAVAFVVMEKE
jgi:holo-[acyl-carrier protein] synthase